MTLREVLDSGQWFRRKSWDGTFEPFVFQWCRESGPEQRVRLVKAPRGDLYDRKVSERRFSPFEVLANDWEIIEP